MERADCCLSMAAEDKRAPECSALPAPSALAQLIVAGATHTGTPSFFCVTLVSGLRSVH